MTHSSTPVIHTDPHTQILYDRAFGGFLSLVQRRMFLSQGPGVILATLSAPPNAYHHLIPPAPSRLRTISLRYIPDAAVPTLDAILAAASRTENLKLIQRAAQTSAHLYSNLPGRYPGQIYVLVVRTNACFESRYHAKVSIMINWLSDTHPAHRAFSAELPLTDQQLVETIFNWDTKEMILPPGCPIRTLPAHIVNTIISEDFYRHCVRTHQRRNAPSDNGQPIIEPSLCPPFAQL